MKRFAAVLLSVLLVVLLTACTGKDTSSGQPSSLPASSDNSSSMESQDTPSSDKPSSSSPQDVSSGQVNHPEARPEEPSQDIIAAPENTPHKNHYVYSSLTNIQKVYYEAMHTAVEAMQQTWIVLGPKTESYGTDIAVVRSALIADHPEIFWLPSYYVTATGTDSEGEATALMMFSASSELSPAYTVTRGERDYMEAELEQAVSEITSAVTATTPFEIELQLHDMLCQRVTYSSDETDSMIYTAYGALVNGRALCEGYSRAMQLLLSRFDITATTVSGVADGEGHMWNLVNIDGDWYNLDVTWNDTANDFISHEYFNITDSEISLDHTFAKDYTQHSKEEVSLGKVSFNIARPVCTAFDADYFVKRGFFFTADKMTVLAELLIAEESNVLEVKFADALAKEDFTSNMTAYIEELNAEITVMNPEADFYIGRISVSSLTLKLYKTEKEEASSEASSFYSL